MTRVSARTLVSAAALAAAIGFLLVSLLLRLESAPGPVPARARHPVPPPFVTYRALAPRDAYGRVAMRSLTPDAVAHVSRLQCMRVHYAGGRGLCAVQEASGTTIAHVVYAFDASLQRGHRFVLDAVPTRLRVAPDGRVGAITTYIEEERPEGERLATRTVLVDLVGGRRLGDVSDFRIDTERASTSGPIDVLGIAFERDGERFFASLATDSERYLAAGSVRERRLSILRPGVAVEAVSPDGRRLAVKRLVPETGFWQLAVIELDTWAERDLNHGARSVDDQVEWLDDGHVLYHDAHGESTALWMLAADGTAEPRVLVRDAYSGSVQR